MDSYGTGQPFRPGCGHGWQLLPNGQLGIKALEVGQRQCTVLASHEVLSKISKILASKVKIWLNKSNTLHSRDAVFQTSDISQNPNNKALLWASSAPPKDIDNAIRATSCTAMTRVGHCRQKLPASGSLPSLLNVSTHWNPSIITHSDLLQSMNPWTSI